MQVRLMKDLFEADLYDLSAAEDHLVFSGREGDSIRIPFSELRHFSVEGHGNGQKRFVLECASGMYEGKFTDPKDPDEFIHLLTEKCGCYMDIRMDME